MEEYWFISRYNKLLLRSCLLLHFRIANREKAKEYNANKEDERHLQLL
jgi:hypothetical protein